MGAWPTPLLPALGAEQGAQASVTNEPGANKTQAELLRMLFPPFF